MDFGVVVSSSWSVKEIMETGVAADKLGLDFFLVTDHYLTPQSVSSADAWTALSGLAANTERIRLGTCVTPIPFRSPPMLAKVIATLDQLSDGRVIVGVGAGWYRREFAAYSTWDTNKVRVDKTSEGIRLMMNLWSEANPINFQGKYIRVEDAILEPKPVQKPHPPLWFGTIGPRMLKMTSKYGDAWVPPVPELAVDAYQQVISTLRQHEANMQRQTPVKVRFNGTVREINDRIDSFLGMGCSGAILARTPFEDMIPAMRQLAHGIAPSYR